MRALLVALVVACGACGDPQPGSLDGSAGDGGTGDTLIDADPNVRGTVTVRIVDKNGEPLPGMYVVFIDRDATVSERMTDAAGTAQTDVYPSASVTAVRARGMSYSIATVQELVPGDDVTLISAASAVSSSEDPFSQRVVPMPSANIAASPNGATKSGSTATFTTLAPHGLVAGDRVIVANVAVQGYNGAWTVSGTPSQTTFTATLGGGNLAASGTASVGATAMKALAFTVGYAAYAGAERYEVRTRCGTTDVGLSTSAQLVLPVGCTAPTMDIEVLAKTSAGATVAWTAQDSVAITADGAVTLTDTWHAPSQLVATYANPTPLVTEIGLARYSPEVRGAAVAETTGAASSTTTLMIDVSKPAAAAIVTQLLCPMGGACLATTSGAARQTIVHAVDGTAGTYALDIGANLLPWVKALYVPATTTLDIMVTGSAPYDLFEANLRFTRGQAIYTWRVFGPIAKSVTFPTLSATAPGNPTVQPSDVMSSYQAFVCESDAIGGYRAAIGNPFEALATCESSANPALEPFAGTRNRISQWN